MEIKRYINKYRLFLRWWLVFTVMCLGTTALYISGTIDKINQVDFTKISFLIYIIFFVFTTKIGVNIYKLCKRDKMTDEYINECHHKNEAGWFVSDVLLSLGMIGTVVGFISMLGTSFSGISASDATSMQGALSTMGEGMGLALYTTISGLICSLLLKLQLFGFAQYLDKLPQSKEKEDAS